MSEGPLKSNENVKGTKETASLPNESFELHKEKEEMIAIARELYESQEVFPFPGLKPESYAKLKIRDEEYPGYTTPTDILLERFKNEGMKVVLSKDPESGNIYILPAQSDDVENDAVLPIHFQISEQLDVKLKELLEKVNSRWQSASIQER